MISKPRIHLVLSEPSRNSAAPEVEAKSGHSLAETTLRIDFLATDSNIEVLEQAKKGLYNALEIRRGLPQDYVNKFFSPQGNLWQISPDIRGMISFQPLNLIHTWSLVGPFDLIFLRNVLIYFSIDTKKEILAKVRKILQPGGYLFLGAAESTLGIDPNFERGIFLRTSCYKLSSPK